ncbi:MAG: efflux RND transporter periplasmic adaptor subunit [Betaproteobacteria bacterium]|nr:efflux RND transporter periplasmic adaptor subunit [Betaproteobacteria bacterium]
MKTRMSQAWKIFLIAAAGSALLALGATGGWWWAGHPSTSAPKMGKTEPVIPQTRQDEAKVLYWYDPMVPQQHFDKPGKSPFMDMQLLPKYADASGAAAGVKIDPAVAQNLGMRLAKVERIPLVFQAQMTGIIGFNERDVAVVQNRSAGFVEHVWPLAPGDAVRAGQPLVEFLVPEWAAAQYELLAIRQSGDAALLAAARDRLRLLGMPERMISAVEQSGVVRSRHTVTAPIGGVIQSLDVRAGMTLMAGQTLSRINGLSTVWLEAAVPQALADRVGTGDRVTATVAGEKTPIEGRVTSIVPVLQDATRTLRVRIELPNRNGHMRPGMSAQLSLQSNPRGTALAVPTESVIRTGKRALVMLADTQGRFTPVEVSLGEEIGDKTVITAGLEEGQQVVSSGQFLLDSEARLSGIAARPMEGTAKPTSPPLHEADATIKGIAPGEVTLAHGPFKTLAMPGMTMTFPLGSPTLTAGFKVGDKVRVGVRQTEDGLVVERIERAEGEQ